MSNIPAKLRLRPNWIGPMTTSGTMKDLLGIVALSLRNGGDNTIDINNGRWTLDSKETLSLNVTEDMGLMDVVGLTITFRSDGATNTSLLQICFLTPSSIPPC